MSKCASRLIAGPPLTAEEQKHFKYTVQSPLLYKGLEDTYYRTSIKTIVPPLPVSLQEILQINNDNNEKKNNEEINSSTARVSYPLELSEDDRFLEDFLLSTKSNTTLANDNATPGGILHSWLLTNVIKKNTLAMKGGEIIDIAEGAVLAVVLKHTGLLGEAKQFAKEMIDQSNLGAYGNSKQQSYQCPPKVKELSLAVSKRFRNWILQQRQLLDRISSSSDRSNNNNATAPSSPGGRRSLTESSKESQQHLSSIAKISASSITDKDSSTSTNEESSTANQEEATQQLMTFEQLIAQIINKCRFLLRFRSISNDIYDTKNDTSSTVDEDSEYSSPSVMAKNSGLHSSLGGTKWDGMDDAGSGKPRSKLTLSSSSR